MLPTKEEFQEVFEARHGKACQKAFSAATVAGCGLGGLGSNIAVSLARAGIGRLILLDGEYRLFLQCDLPPRRCKQLLAEYGTLCAEGTLPLSFLREHGKLLCENDAIEKLTIGL